MRQEYSIISKRDKDGTIKHSYTGKINTNANIEDLITRSFNECVGVLVYEKTPEKHKRLLSDSSLKISKIETKIIEYIK